MAASDGTPPVLILTAGLGTRLRPLTRLRAKPAVPVNGEPLVRRIIRWLARDGARDVVLNLHHQPASITRVVGDGGDLGVRVRYSWEQPVLGSAGGPRRALPLLAERPDDPFLIVNGDTLTTASLAGLVTAHREWRALVTMALIPNPRPDTYGGVVLSKAGDVQRFSRPGADSEGTYHFIGVQVAQARTFADLPDGVPCNSVGGVYSRLVVESPGAVKGWICTAEFSDIGTPADYLTTSLRLAAEEGDRLTQAARAVHPTARVVRTALWNDVVVGADARLIDCIVADRARVPDGASYERCALVPAAGEVPDEGERIDGELLVRAF